MELFIRNLAPGLVSQARHPEYSQVFPNGLIHVVSRKMWKTNLSSTNMVSICIHQHDFFRMAYSLCFHRPCR